jgi:hypothetical protein
MDSHVCESVTVADPEWNGVGALLTQCGVCHRPMPPDGDGVVEQVAADRLGEAILHNDIAHAPIVERLALSDRRKLAKFLWLQGWRRDYRDEDFTP